ncbi:haloacid dehalogenase, type II [Talaromyces proteolyticus]|uniref:Haloacid dehalogenase, type II n=1 Tax=Talaromyces proteolyticus TaxID=1131652 RepID=A0AAD4Q0F0_9EURO|nr:haloacid dehalogenase, type II [Talaromyces proteolyticus]KAH8697098.1 haloacid dehalogenase, type II [Talaromyces proteolyticus]
MAGKPAAPVIAFDLYGTLLSTQSIAARLAELVGSQEKAAQIATTWRKYQLEYSWRLTCMGHYDTFFNITRNSLVHALSEAHVDLREDVVNRLMGEYDHLSTFSDVEPALRNLSTRPDIKVVIFSNGTQEMVSNSVFRSKDLSPHATVFKDLITVDEIQKYKPAPEVYHHLSQKVGKNMEDIWLISGNPFDIIGATKVGIKAAWLDRSNSGWEDCAVPTLRPRIIKNSLDDIIKFIIGEHTT